MNKNASPNPEEKRIASEIRSGFFVLLAAATFLTLIFISGQSQWVQGNEKYTILYNYIGGLAENAPVHLAGHKIGKVTKIEYIGAKEGAIRISLSVHKSAIIRQDSKAYIDALGLMGEKYVEISAGTPDSSPVQPGGAIQGADPIPMMEMIKKGTEIMEQFERTGDAMEGLLGNLQTIVGDHQEALCGTIENVHEMSGNFNQMSVNLKEMSQDLKWHPWKLLRKSKPPKEALEAEAKTTEESKPEAEAGTDSEKSGKKFLIF